MGLYPGINCGECGHSNWLYGCECKNKKCSCNKKNKEINARIAQLE